LKIFSVEKPEESIEYSLKQDLLIPCWIYKVAITSKKNQHLNFLEETITKLIEIDPSLKSDEQRLSTMLGFHSKNTSEDRTEIVKLVLRRIKDMRLPVYDYENDAKVTVLQFYREAYTKEFLPIITKDYNTYSHPEYSKKSDLNGAIEVGFKQNMKSSRLVKAIMIDGFDENVHDDKNTLKRDILRTIYSFRQADHDIRLGLDNNSMKTNATRETEPVFLHTKLYILRQIDSFTVTNGLTNDFSTQLRKVYELKYPWLITELRQKLKYDGENISENQVKIPFENGLQRYSDIYYLVLNIEKNFRNLDSDITDVRKIKESKHKLIESIYDTYEKLFELLSKDLTGAMVYRDRKLVNDLAVKIGFMTDFSQGLKVLRAGKRENLQKYLVKSIFGRSPELNKIAYEYPQLLMNLEKLLNLRNGVKHSELDETLQKIEKEGLERFRSDLYPILSIALHVNRISVQNDEFETGEYDTDNAWIALEKEIPIDIINRLPTEVIDHLTIINFYLGQMDFESNKYNVVKDVTNLMYSIFEKVIKEILIVPARDNEADIPTKQEILTGLGKSVAIGKSLTTVGSNMIENAFRKQNASLGAYALVYLYQKQNPDQNEIWFLEEVINLRGHGSPTSEEVAKISKEQLEVLRNTAIKYLIKFLENGK